MTAVNVEAVARLLERLEDSNLETQRALQSALVGLAAQRCMLKDQRGALRAAFLGEAVLPALARQLQAEALHGMQAPRRSPGNESASSNATPASASQQVCSFALTKSGLEFPKGGSKDLQLSLHGDWVDSAKRWYHGSVIRFDEDGWHPLHGQKDDYTWKLHETWAELIETQDGSEMRRFKLQAGAAPGTLRVSCRGGNGTSEQWTLQKADAASSYLAAAASSCGPRAGSTIGSQLMGRFGGEADSAASRSAYSDSDASEEDTETTGVRSVANKNLAHMRDSLHSIVRVKDVIIPRNMIQTWILPVLERTWFNLIFLTLIIANIVCLGIEIDEEVNQAMHSKCERAEHCRDLGRLKDEEVVQYISQFDRFCLFMFILEISVRLLGEQEQFFCGPNRWWNLFEFCIIMFTGLDELFHIAHDNLAAFRSLRVLRLCRIIRFFTFFRFLRMMLFSFLCCFGSLFWAILLVVVATYVFAIYVEFAVKQFIVNSDALDVRWKEDEWWDQFGGIDAAFKSLIFSISGGEDWAKYVELFWQISPVHGWTYVGFVLFMMFGMLNIIVSVFVQETADILTWDRELVLDTSLNKQEFTKTQLRQLFLQIDGIKDGVRHDSITMDELKHAMKDVRIQAFFAHLNIDLAGESLVDFFQLLDANNSGEVTMDEFVEGCMRFQGTAKPMVQAHMERTLDTLSKRLLLLERNISSNWNYRGGAATPACENNAPCNQKDADIGL